VQVYGDNAIKKTAVYKWVKIFLREEKVSMTMRSGWPRRSRTEENIAKVRQTVRENFRLSGA